MQLKIHARSIMIERGCCTADFQKRLDWPVAPERFDKQRGRSLLEGE